MIISGTIFHINEALQPMELIVLITNNRTHEFSKLIKHHKHINITTSITEEALFKQLSNLIFITKSLVFHELLQLHQSYYSEMERHITSNENGTLISPLGVANVDIKFINEAPLEHLPFTTIINQNLLNMHQISCSLKPLKSLLITILQFKSFIISDLEEFLILENLVVAYGYISERSISFTCLEKGIRFLQDNHWVLKMHDLSPYVNKKHQDFYNNFLCWKEFFHEESISICECYYTSCKDMNKYTYYGKKENVPAPFMEKVSFPFRQVIVPLAKPQIIKDAKLFYLNKVLKLGQEENKSSSRKTKFSSLQSSELTNELNFIY